MKLSLIIPTFNAEPYLDRLLSSLSAQSVKNSEILIVDSESTDRTRDILKARGVRFYSVPKASFDHGGTRSWAARKAKGDILIFLTQDALPADPYSLKRIVQPFREDPDIGAVYGRQVAYPGASPFAAHSRSFIYPGRSFTRVLADRDRYKIKTAFLSNAFTAYRRTALRETGYFKDNLISTEDTYAGAKMLLAGWKLAYAASAVVYHSHNYTVRQEFSRYFDIGVFHRTENWILREFGKANDEGLRYVLSEFRHLMKGKYYLKLPEFFLRNMLKYAGYRLGYNYRLLPRWLTLLWSMHRGWWLKNPGFGKDQHAGHPQKPPSKARTRD